MDINTKKLKKNAFRVTKKRGSPPPASVFRAVFATRRFWSRWQKLPAYGDGSVHLTTRQGFEIEGFPWRTWKGQCPAAAHHRKWTSTR